MVFSNDQATNDEIDALFNTLADEQAAAWARFYAIEVDSLPRRAHRDFVRVSCLRGCGC